ncbi:MAG: hypothetical protein R3Y36_05775 [Spirochaetales bacterium]
MRNIVLILFLCYLHVPVFSQIIDYYDDIAEEVYRSYIHEGRMPTFYFAPLLPGDVLATLQTIPLQVTQNMFTRQDGRSGATLSVFAGASAQFFSQNVSVENIEEGQANNAIDYIKNYLWQPPMTGFSFEMFSKIGLGGGMLMEVNPRFDNDYFSTWNISDYIDKNFLQSGYVYFDNPYVSLLIGRVNTQMGLLYSDAIFFNNNIPYTDSARLYIPFGKYFNFHWQIINIPAVESAYQQDVQTGNDFKSSSGDVLGSDYYYGFEDDDFPSIILNMYQRFGFQNDFLRAGLAWNVFLVRRNNRFEFADFFPFAEWHATDVIPNNMSIGADFGIVPVKNLLLNVQLGFDEINGNDIGIGDGDTPTIWSLIATMQNTVITNNFGILFSTNIGYSHYLWGNFSGTSVLDATEANLAKALYRYNMQSPMYMPFTSSYGPGALWFSLESIITFSPYSSAKGLTLNPNILVLLKESDTNLITTAYENRNEDVQNTLYFCLEAPVAYAWRTFDFSVTPSFHVKALSVSTVTWFELKLSATVYFSSSSYEKNGDVLFDFEY